MIIKLNSYSSVSCTKYVAYLTKQCYSKQGLFHPTHTAVSSYWDFDLIKGSRYYHLKFR